MESELGRVMDGLPALVWTATPDGRIDFSNRRWFEYRISVRDRPRQMVITAERDEDVCVRLTVQDAGMGFERDVCSDFSTHSTQQRARVWE